jgi:hypothetical protein
MKRFRVGILGTLLLLLLWAVPAKAGAQTPPSPPATTQTNTTPPIDVNLNRIRTALGIMPSIRFDEPQIRFYVDVYGHEARFWDFIGTFDLKNGPTPHAGMTHQDFLDMVAPKNMNFGSPSLKGIAEVAAASLAGNYLLSKLREALRHAPTEADRRRIQAQIDRELAALAGK